MLSGLIFAHRLSECSMLLSRRVGFSLMSASAPDSKGFVLGKAILHIQLPTPPTEVDQGPSTRLTLAPNNDDGESIRDWGWTELQLFGYCTCVLSEFRGYKVRFRVLLTYDHRSGSDLSFHFLKH